MEEVREPCIYRVPSGIRDVKPQAYTPRMVVIGPLHRSPNSTANDGAETSSNPWHLKEEYMKMEDTKKTFFESYTQRVGEDTIEEMRKTIQAEEKNIRASYKEPAEWIPSEYYVELILLDSVFIMELLLKNKERPFNDDFVIKQDLMLLENQLPYFILDRLFSSSMEKLHGRKMTVDHFILIYFVGIPMKEYKNFKHFTDMFRCVYEESLDYDIIKQMERSPWRWSPITELRNADNLSKAGVDFKVLNKRAFEIVDQSILNLSLFQSSDLVDSPKFEKHFGKFHRTFRLRGSKVTVRKRGRVHGCSLHVEFEKGSLTMPAFHANEEFDMRLRNVIAFEQCHLAVIPVTSNYIHFLNFLITSNRDVQLLSEEGVVRNAMGRPSLVLDMVNKLQVGVKVGYSSQYHRVAMKLKAHYKSRRKMCWATLRKVYFSDLWTGTATLAAVLLLLLTLIGTVASVIQAYESFK